MNKFLDIRNARGVGDTIYLTDNPNSPLLAKGNQDEIANYFTNLKLGERLFGLNQNIPVFVPFVFITPSLANIKNPLNVLIHETGHLKWTGLGKKDVHDAAFFKLLSDTLKALGLQMRGNEVNGMSPSQLDSAPLPLDYDPPHPLLYNSGHCSCKPIPGSGNKATKHERQQPQGNTWTPKRENYNTR